MSESQVIGVVGPNELLERPHASGAAWAVRWIGTPRIRDPEPAR